MKANRLAGRLLALVATLAMALALAPAAALAADASTIDTSTNCSLTIHKYKGDELKGVDTNGDGYVSTDEWSKADTSKLTGMDGVTFNYLNVGGVKQYTKDGTTAIGYSVSSELKTFLGLTDKDVAYTEGSTGYYSTGTLDDALDKKSQSQLEAFMRDTVADKTKIGSMTTAGGGTATVSSLTQGLYLVVEKTYPAGTTATTQPFLVSLPTTVLSGTSYDWQYSVDVYPKNTVEDTNISKVVVEDGNESSAIDGEIGQDKTFRIRASVPGSVGKLKTYRVVDTLSTGLDYKGSPVAYGVKDGVETKLTLGTDYTATQDGQKVTFNFTTTKLAYTSDEVDLNKGIDAGMARYDSVRIDYLAALNANAVVGGTKGNPNSATLEFSKNTNVDTTETDKDLEKSENPVTATVFTYAVSLTKIGNGDASTKLSGVKFELYRDSVSDANKASVVKTGTGYCFGSGTGATTELTTDSDGKIYLYGLETGTYYLKETATNAGYNLLAEPIKLEIKSDEGQYEASSTGTYAEVTASSEYYAAADKTGKFAIPALPSGVTSAYMNFGTSSVYDASGATIQMYAPKALGWRCTDYTMGASEATDGTSGVVGITVNNTKGFTLPKTGTAMALYVLIGVALVAASGLIVRQSRKRAAAGR